MTRRIYGSQKRTIIGSACCNNQAPSTVTLITFVGCTTFAFVTTFRNKNYVINISYMRSSNDDFQKRTFILLRTMQSHEIFSRISVHFGIHQHNSTNSQPILLVSNFSRISRIDIIVTRKNAWRYKAQTEQLLKTSLWICTFIHWRKRYLASKG